MNGGREEDLNDRASVPTVHLSDRCHDDLHGFKGTIFKADRSRDGKAGCVAGRRRRRYIGNK